MMTCSFRRKSSGSSCSTANDGSRAKQAMATLARQCAARRTRKSAVMIIAPDGFDCRKECIDFMHEYFPGQYRIANFLHLKRNYLYRTRKRCQPCQACGVFHEPGERLLYLPIILFRIAKKDVGVVALIIA
jgi:hypothetical protein